MARIIKEPEVRKNGILGIVEELYFKSKEQMHKQQNALIHRKIQSQLLCPFSGSKTRVKLRQDTGKPFRNGKYGGTFLPQTVDVLASMVQDLHRMAR